MLRKVAQLTTLFLGYWLSLLAWSSVHASEELSVLSVELPDIESLDGVFAIAQDKYGFMWFGGKNGLRRYDGYKVDVFRHDPQVPGSISSNDVSDILVDRQGRLWVALLSRGGLNRFDERTQTFIAYRKDPADPHSIGSHDIYAMVEDNNGDLWLATHDNGLNRLDHSTGKFHRMPISLPGRNDGAVRDLTIDRLGNVWAASDSLGLFKVNDTQKKFKHYAHSSNDENSLCSNYLSAIYNDKNDNLWVGTRDCGLARFNPNTGGFDTYQTVTGTLSSNTIEEIYDIQEDGSGRLWVSNASSEIYHFNTHQKQLEKRVISTKKTPSVVPIRRMFRDRTGSLWLGGDYSKLFLHSDYTNQFNVLKTESVYVSNTISDVVADRYGDIWVAGRAGLLKTQNRVSKILEPVMKGKKAENILIDFDGNLWVDTDTGIEVYDIRNRHWSTANSELNTLLKGEKIWHINQTKNGDLWFATQSLGLIQYNTISHNITQHAHDSNNTNTISHDFVWMTLEDSKGNLWVGTLWGLSFLDLTTLQWSQFHREHDNTKSLCDNSVRSLSEDKNGNLWLATNACLAMYNPNTQIFKAYYVSDGLADDSLTAVYSDSRGYIWATTQKGITRYNAKTDVFKNYDARHGAAASTYPRKARILELGSGELVISGVFGVSTVDLSTFKDNALVPPVVITGISVDGRDLTEGERNPNVSAPHLIKDVTLTTEQKVLTIDFSALNYIFPEQNLYQYKLQGFDDHWTKASPYQRAANYTNLSSGEYTFLVKGSNNQGLWNDTPAQLTVFINANIWSNYWRYFLCVVLAFISALVFFYRAKSVQKNRLVSSSENDKAQFYRQILNNLSNEMLPKVNTVLSLADHIDGDITNDLAMKNKSQAKMIIANAESLIDLINEVNSLTNGITRETLNFREVLPEQIIESVVSWFKPKVEGKGLKLYLNIEGDLPTIKADYTSINKVVFTLIANAIKHTEHGYIEVLVERKDDLVHIEVADTGKGMDEDSIEGLFINPASFGKKRDLDFQIDLEECKRLLALHNATFSLESKPETGCVFSVYIPASAATNSDVVRLDQQT